MAEVSLRYAQDNNDIFRIDGEYFQKEHLKNEFIRRKNRSFRIGEVDAQVRSFGAYSLNNDVEYLDDGIPFIRGINMKNGRVNFSNMLFINDKMHELLWKSEVKEGMVLLSMSGSIGDVAIATSNWKYPINSNQDIAKIQMSDAYDSYVLYVFLLSKYGQNYLKREARGSVQQHVFLSQIEQIEVPIFNEPLKSVIRRVVEMSDRCEVQAALHQSAAETTLLQALNLTNWQAPEPLSYTRSSSDAFAAGRLDAEHFQPKFQVLLAHLLSTGRAKTLGDVLLLNQRGKQPDYIESGVPVVNSKHINKGEVRIDSDNRCAQTDDETVLIQPGDVVMNGTGVGTIGRAAPYLHNFGAVPDNHVTILKPKFGMDAVYLSVFINSLAGQMQVAQRLRGSSGQIELYPNDIARFMVWDAPEEVQTSIRQLVIQSFEAKQRATQLLDAAKRAVEIAIEESEDAALAHLQLVAND